MISWYLGVKEHCMAFNDLKLIVSWAIRCTKIHVLRIFGVKLVFTPPKTKWLKVYLKSKFWPVIKLGEKDLCSGYYGVC